MQPSLRCYRGHETGEHAGDGSERLRGGLLVHAPLSAHRFGMAQGIAGEGGGAGHRRGLAREQVRPHVSFRVTGSVSSGLVPWLGLAGSTVRPVRGPVLRELRAGYPTAGSLCSQLTAMTVLKAIDFDPHQCGADRATQRTCPRDRPPGLEAFGSTAD